MRGEGHTSKQRTATKPRLMRAWPQLRALLIALHLVAITLAALPRVGREVLSKSSRESPAARAELDAWTDRLASWGIEVEPAALEQTALRTLRAWLELRTRLTAPVQPYIRSLGLGQPWMLFPGPDRNPAQVVVELERGGEWRPLQTMYPLTTSWQAPLLSSPRVRGIVYASSWPIHRQRHAELGRWLAIAAAREFPDATRLRVHIETTRTLEPEEVRAGVVPERSSRRATTYELAELR